MTQHVITTTINQQPYAVTADAAAGAFKAICIAKSSGLSKAFQGDVTSCLRILEWIHANDHGLSKHEWHISPSAKFMR